MSSHEQTCYTCWTTFYTSHPFVTTCPTCRQTQEITRSHDRQLEAQREQADIARREQEYYARQQIAAEQARINAINKQTNIILEQRISAQEAYDRGYNYLTTEYISGNSLGLKLIQNQFGSIEYSWQYAPYWTPSLNDQFKHGLDEYIYPDRGNKYDELKDSAYRSGYQIAMGTLNTTFALNSCYNINGEDIPSETFYSNLTSKIDEETGTIIFNWHHPFLDSGLNQKFHDGVNDAAIELNTDEWKTHRLTVTIPEIQKERKLKKKYNALNITYFLGTILYIPLAIFWILTNAEGWQWVYYPAIASVIWYVLVVIYNSWQEKNKKYLEDE